MPKSLASESPPSALQLAEDVIRMTARSSHLPAGNFIRLAWEHVRAFPDSLAQWELAALEGEGSKPVIETRSGPSFSTEQTAEFLKRSTQTVRNMVERRALIAYPEIHGRGWRFPRWQFRHGGVQDWVPALLQSYGHNGWGLLDFLTVPRLAGGESFTWLERLKSGKIGNVLAAARRSNPD